MTPEILLQAKERIAPFVKPTPVLESKPLKQLLDYPNSIFLKLDCENPTGSFKVRGAFNIMLQTPKEADKVTAVSSGNFAQAVAYAANKLGKKATIIMPDNAPKIKIEGTRKWGAEIIFIKNRQEEGYKMINELVEKGYYPLHPFNDYRTMAGQGTLALEVLESNPTIQHFFCPVGGGGLMSGCASAIKFKDPSIKTYSVEPYGAHDFYESFQAKKHIAFEKIDTIADGLRSESVGELNYPILMKNVDQALCVTEKEIIDAMRFFWNHHQLMIEPSGAVALAGFIQQHKKINGDVLIVVSGKNVDRDHFEKWLSKEDL